MKIGLLTWLSCLLLSFQCLQGQYSPMGSPQHQMRFYGNNSACPYLFLSVNRVRTPFFLKSTNMLIDQTGDLIWYQQVPMYTLDFELHPNGRMAYNDNHQWHILDSTFAEVDSVACVGYGNDIHDMRMTADGHIFLICIEDTVMDLSSLMTTGGFPGAVNGRVDGGVIQELDAGKNVVHEWHGLDHYQIQDVDSAYFQNPSILELTHTNSFDLNANGKMLLSHRSLNEISQIDWLSGEVEWQLSGKENQFDLQADPGTIGQHDARYLPNGRISAFDNGNHARTARAVVYALDTVQMRASVDWQYSPPATESDAMGSFRQMADGSAIIGLGRVFPTMEPFVSYVAADSSKIFDIWSIDSSSSYRAVCSSLPFQLHRPKLNCQEVGGQVVLGVEGFHAEYDWTNGQTSATIVVADTGWYQAFVPQGVGMMSTAPYHITDLDNACLALEQEPYLISQPRPRLVGWYDLLGRPMSAPMCGQVYIERYSDGSSKKIFRPR